MQWALHLLVFTSGLTACSSARAQVQLSVQPLVNLTVAHEDAEAATRGHYRYSSLERSERTGMHLWTERVIEVPDGKLRMLIAEDGHLLEPARATAERKRLSDIASNPNDFRKQEQARQNDELKVKELLDLLPTAFVFSNPRQEGLYTRIDFLPNPAYSAPTMEAKVLHGMNGSMLITSSGARLHEIEGKLASNVTIGFGLLATINAGSTFSTVRDPVPGNEWKTTAINTDIQGRAILFKSLAKKRQVEHRDFHQVPFDLSLAKAVTLLEQ